MKKRLLSLLLTVCLVAALVTGLTGTANADDDKVVGYLTSYTLKAGDTITFTDVNGNVFTYTVREFASVTPDDSDTVMNSGYALTMYTCNWDTTERVTVFCERTGGDLPVTD